ncbi:NAD(P)/FAD-dependent oxidoreductase [Rathayibacter sp. CAU 1779]
MSISNVVIIGAGQAGYQTAASLRQHGFDGSITLLSDEAELPYQRPPLSKGYLLGTLDERRLAHRQERWYEDQRVTLLHDAAVGIERASHTVTSASGAELTYDHLVLATGARNRNLQLTGSDLDGVTGMRTKADADSLAARLHPGSNVIVVGAGFIGLEFTSVAAALGATVHVFELADRPMGRALTDATAEFFRVAHERRGVRFDFGQGLTSIDGSGGRVTGVTTGDGRTLDADIVVTGIGVVPNTALAEAAGLEVENGIRVDAKLVTADPHISAVGDAVSFPCRHLGGVPIRLESVQNAADHARHVAARLMGKADDYGALPWFWSDQGEYKLQIAGLSQGYDRLVDLSAVDAGQKAVLCFRDDRLVAVETVNRPGDHMIARRLLAGSPGLTVREAEQPGFTLSDYDRGGRVVESAVVGLQASGGA